MNNLGTITLETERLILRKGKISDSENMFNNWANSDEVTKYIQWKPYNDVDGVRQYIQTVVNSYEKNDTYYWFIELKENSQAIGTISVVEYDSHIDCAAIGYCIGSAWWHKGIMTEAFSAVIKFLMEEVGVNRIEATHLVQNENSGKVMKKCGLKYEGTKRQGTRDNNGNLCDISYYAMLKSDYIQQNLKISG